MISSNSYPMFGMQNDIERYSWAIYHLFVLLSSLVGDILILYASFKEDAFKLNEFIVTIMRYIAVADLAYSVSSVLPSAISLFANSWTLGDSLCYARVYSGYFIYPAGMWLIAVLTTSKLLRLKFPMRCAHWTRKMAVQVCSLTAFPAITFLILFLVVDKNDVVFDYRIYTCIYGFEAKIWMKLRPVISIVVLFLPNIVIVATTIPTLKYLADARKSARRVQGSVPWQGAATVALTAVVYCVSTLPNFVYNISISFIKEDPTSLFQFRFYRVTEFLLMINIMSNFYIYTLTIKSFRRFVLSKIHSALPVQLMLKRCRIMNSTGESNIMACVFVSKLKLDSIIYRTRNF